MGVYFGQKESYHNDVVQPYMSNCFVITVHVGSIAEVHCSR